MRSGGDRGKRGFEERAREEGACRPSLSLSLSRGKMRTLSFFASFLSCPRELAKTATLRLLLPQIRGSSSCSLRKARERSKRKSGTREVEVFFFEPSPQGNSPSSLLKEATSDKRERRNQFARCSAHLFSSLSTQTETNPGSTPSVPSSKRRGVLHGA